MTNFLKIFLSVSPFWRRGTLCAILLLVIALSVMFCRQSYQDLHRLQWDEYPSLVSRYHQQIEILRQPPSLPHLIVRNQQLQTDMQDAVHPFSLSVLLAESGGMLEKWQPEKSHSYLSLTLGWKGVQQLFAYFAQKQSVMRIEQFTLQQSDSQLKVIFTLQESSDESTHF